MVRINGGLERARLDYLCIVKLGEYRHREIKSPQRWSFLHKLHPFRTCSWARCENAGRDGISGRCQVGFGWILICQSADTYPGHYIGKDNFVWFVINSSNSGRKQNSLQFSTIKLIALLKNSGIDWNSAQTNCSIAFLIISWETRMLVQSLLRGSTKYLSAAS